MLNWVQTFGPQLAAFADTDDGSEGTGLLTKYSAFVVSESFTCIVREVNMDGSRPEESEASTKPINRGALACKC